MDTSPKHTCNDPKYVRAEQLSISNLAITQMQNRTKMRCYYNLLIWLKFKGLTILNVIEEWRNWKFHSS